MAFVIYSENALLCLTSIITMASGVTVVYDEINLHCTQKAFWFSMAAIFL